METNTSNNRFKWVFLLMLLGIGMSLRLLVAHVGVVPHAQRMIWALGIMGLYGLPFGFVFGRNSARKDCYGKLSRFLGCGAALCVLVGIAPGTALGRRGLLYAGMGGGFLIGFALGRLAHRRAAEKYGDTLEADQYLNVVRSESMPKPEPPAIAFLKSQDEETQRLLKRFMAVQILAILAGAGLGLWPVFTDSLQAITHALFVHANDGTRYFITVDPLAVALPLMMLGAATPGYLFGMLLARAAGPRRDAWRHYCKLIGDKRSSPRTDKVNSVLAVGFLCAAALALIMFLNCYLKVTDSGITIKRFWALGAKHYGWSEVRDVQISREPYTDKHHQRTRPRIRVNFTDDSAWAPDTSFDRRTPQIEAAARFIAAHKVH